MAGDNCSRPATVSLSPGESKKRVSRRFLHTQSIQTLVALEKSLVLLFHCANEVANTREGTAASSVRKCLICANKTFGRERACGCRVRYHVLWPIRSSRSKGQNWGYTRPGIYSTGGRYLPGVSGPACSSHLCDLLIKFPRARTSRGGHALSRSISGRARETFSATIGTFSWMSPPR